jgi:hypothetical protein
LLVENVQHSGSFSSRASKITVGYRRQGYSSLLSQMKNWQNDVLTNHFGKTEWVVISSRARTEQIETPKIGRAHAGLYLLEVRRVFH